MSYTESSSSSEYGNRCTGPGLTCLKYGRVVALKLENAMGSGDEIIHKAERRNAHDVGCLGPIDVPPEIGQPRSAVLDRSR